MTLLYFDWFTNLILSLVDCHTVFRLVTWCWLVNLIGRVQPCRDSIGWLWLVVPSLWFDIRISNARFVVCDVTRGSRDMMVYSYWWNTDCRRSVVSCTCCVTSSRIWCLIQPIIVLFLWRQSLIGQRWLDGGHSLAAGARGWSLVLIKQTSTHL